MKKNESDIFNVEFLCKKSEFFIPKITISASDKTLIYFTDKEEKIQSYLTKTENKNKNLSLIYCSFEQFQGKKNKNFLMFANLCLKRKNCFQFEDVRLNILSNFTLFLESKTFGFVFPFVSMLEKQQEIYQEYCIDAGLEGGIIKHMNFEPFENYPVRFFFF